MPAPVSLTVKAILWTDGSGDRSTEARQAHPATIGELDGVGQQVDQDLLQSNLIARKFRGYVMRDAQPDLEVLSLCQRTDQFAAVPEHLVQVEGRGLELKAGMVLRVEIQNIAENRQQ